MPVLPMQYKLFSDLRKETDAQKKGCTGTVEGWRV